MQCWAWSWILCIQTTKQVQLQGTAGQPAFNFCSEASTAVQAEEKAMYEQIDIDFAPYSNGITLEMVEQAYCACRLGGFRFQVWCQYLMPRCFNFERRGMICTLLSA